MAIGERCEGILTAACRVIARRGFHQALIREIARAAGLSLAGLYHYLDGFLGGSETAGGSLPALRKPA